MEDSKAVLKVLFCLFMPKLIELCSLWGGALSVRLGQGGAARDREWATETKGMEGRSLSIRAFLGCQGWLRL